MNSKISFIFSLRQLAFAFTASLFVEFFSPSDSRPPPFQVPVLIL